jgi:DNA-binding NarL/FixJ family response regulator
MKNPSILLADDHSMIRKAIRLTLDFHCGLGQAPIKGVGSCNQLMKELSKAHYTHLILDIHLDDGSSLEVLPNIRALYPDLQIIIFSQQPYEIFGPVIKNKYGIGHYISKSDSEETIISLLNLLFNSPQSASSREAKTETTAEKTPFRAISAREFEVLHYWLQGQMNKEIACNLNLATSTVSVFKRRILEKTKAKNIMELKDLATLHKIV